MADILVEESFYMGTSSACVIDLTPPVFAGINFLDVESRGQIRAGWSAATDANNPIRYEVYIQASTATGLFNTVNITGITDKLQLDIFTLPDGSFLENGQVYYVGVRAVDALGNRDANTVSDDVISTGVLTAIDTYESKIAYSIDEDNQFRITAWANKNSSLAVPPSAVLGLSSYQIYDKLGNAVIGMSGSGVSANAEGLYVFPAISNLLETELEHYEVRIAVIVDGEARVNHVPLMNQAPLYTADAGFSVNVSNQFIGGFWVKSNGSRISDPLRISNGHYHVHDSNGNGVPGLTESGISPTSDGLFIITPTSAALLDLQSATYFVHVRAEVDGVLVQDHIALSFEAPVYEPKALFSINALNQFQATLWATANDSVKTSNIGTASYQVFDVSGAPVAGLSQSGIVADVNGRYQITPVSAALLTDLTHYSVRVAIFIDGVERVSYKGFTLLGT